MSSTPGGRDPFLLSDSDCESIDSPLSVGDDSPHAVDVAPLSLVPNSKTERSGAGYGALPRKPTSFGLNAKRQLLRCGGALEKTAPTEEVLFLTGTLPGSTEDAFKAIASYSGYIVNSLKAWISTYVPEKLDFYVWEYQKRGALHLHYAVWVPDVGHRRFILDSFKEWWVQALHRVSDLAGCDLFRKNSGKTWLGDESKVRAVAEVCRKSVARYLAKYLSKSSTPRRGAARLFTPSRWWGTSRPLKALTSTLTTTTEIIVSSVQNVRRRWEDVYAVCASSDSVTYCYRHNVGVGQTAVSYPSTEDEFEWLRTALEAFSMIKKKDLTEPLRLPSRELKTLKVAQIRWLEQSLTNLPEAQQGLRNVLSSHLSWMQILTPSTSQEPLSVLLAWAARLSDIVSMSRFTPLWTWQNTRMFDDWMSVLEENIALVAEHGWS